MQAGTSRVKSTNIIVLAVLTAFLVVIVAQLRSPPRIPVAVTPSAGDTSSETAVSVGRFVPGEASLATRSFERQVAVSEMRQRWITLGLPVDLPEAVVDGRLSTVVQQLESVAAQANDQANFVLAVLEDFCEDVRVQRDVSADRWIREAQNLEPAQTAHVRNAAGTMRWIAEQLYLQCREPVFDSLAIQARLREAAGRDHLPSLWRVGLLDPEPESSYREVREAALGRYLPAELTLASLFRADAPPLFAGQSVIGSRSLWLQQAAEHSVIGQSRLGECYRQGCDGRDPAPARAVEYLTQAARSGDREAILGLASIAESDKRAVRPEQAWAWRAFAQRLNDVGCYGQRYVDNYIDDARVVPVLEARLGERALADAKTLLDQYWDQYGAGAREHLGCAGAS